MGVTRGSTVGYEVVLEHVPSLPLSPYFFHQSVIPTFPEKFFKYASSLKIFCQLTLRKYYDGGLGLCLQKREQKFKEQEPGEFDSPAVCCVAIELLKTAC